MPTLADSILDEDMQSISRWLTRGDIVNQLDEYGFTPLIEAAIVDNIAICKLLLAQGADPNQQDLTGGTALHWAVENSNQQLCTLLLDNGANPNAYNFSGQPVLVMPMLRHQTSLRQLLVKRGADPIFAQDYNNTKMLGHIFELIGTANIVSPQNQYVEVDFEGFFLEITLSLVSESLSQFRNHFAARQLRRFSGLAQYIIEVINRASQLIKYQQYRVDVSKYRSTIDGLIRQQPLLIPVGYEGHAITFVRYGDIWAKCDRREDSRLYDNIMFYKMQNPRACTVDFVKQIIYEKQDSQFINAEIDNILDLVPVTELKVEAQISGNCSWANVEATVPTLFFLILMQASQDMESMTQFKTQALNFFHRWREWNKDRSLDYCIQSYQTGDVIRKACKAEILAAILFQRSNTNDASDQRRVESILAILLNSPYEYILKNYLRVYYYEGITEEGKHFAELLKQYDFPRS